MAFSASELLLPYQKAWFEDRSRVAICEKSRRTGLSWAEAAVQVMMASSSRKAGGKNCFYLSYNKDMTRQFIEDCRWWAEKIGVVAQRLEENIWPDPGNPDRDMLVFTLRFASGFSIQALPGKATALRSKQGRVCIDEAAFVEDLSKIIKAALALLMWGGEVRIISTHDGVDNPNNPIAIYWDERSRSFWYVGKRNGDKLTLILIGQRKLPRNHKAIYTIDEAASVFGEFENLEEIEASYQGRLEIVQK